MKQPSSFRDPAGFIFIRAGILYRQINRKGMDDYRRLIESGLYDYLVKKQWLVTHTETNIPAEEPVEAGLIIQPQKIDFISYPYEWCFSQLQDAALLTLEIQKAALSFNLSLKDASAYNIQFVHGRPIFLDTLSFEAYEECQPWAAYRQFCQHFLAPLALMSCVDLRLIDLLKIYLDGIPLDLTAELLPNRARLNSGLLLHIFAQASAQKRYARKVINSSERSRIVSRNGFLGLIDSLENTVRNLKLKPRQMKTAWANYYHESNYSVDATDDKTRIIDSWLKLAHPQNVWDLGANTGHFSQVASQLGMDVIAMDIDPGVMELNYQSIRKAHETHILPLRMDLTNPSPAIGWRSTERDSLIKRANVDLVMALALIHHLAIGNNLPLEEIAEYFSEIGEWLILEFVPKSDTQVQRLLANRNDIFIAYTTAGLEKAFKKYYFIENVHSLTDSERTLYLMRRKPVPEIT
jgi:hypothetical protein